MSERTFVHPEGSWLSYAQVGELFGLSADAARVKARRAGWRRQPGNDGRTLVLVPSEAADEQNPGRTPGRSTPIEVLGQAVETLTAQLEAERTRADTVRAEAAAALALADRLTAQVADAGERADRAEARAGQAEQARDQARDAHQGTLQALRRMEAAEAERKARGRLRRAWQAWRGE